MMWCESEWKYSLAVNGISVPPCWTLRQGTLLVRESPIDTDLHNSGGSSVGCLSDHPSETIDVHPSSDMECASRYSKGSTGSFGSCPSDHPSETVDVHPSGDTGMRLHSKERVRRYSKGSKGSFGSIPSDHPSETVDVHQSSDIGCVRLSPLTGEGGLHFDEVPQRQRVHNEYSGVFAGQTTDEQSNGTFGSVPSDHPSETVDVHQSSDIGCVRLSPLTGEGGLHFDDVPERQRVHNKYSGVFARQTMDEQSNWTLDGLGSGVFARQTTDEQSNGTLLGFALPVRQSPIDLDLYCDEESNGGCPSDHPSETVDVHQSSDMGCVRLHSKASNGSFGSCPSDHPSETVDVHPSNDIGCEHPSRLTGEGGLPIAV